MMKGFRVFLALGALTIAACSGGGPRSPDFSPVTTVQSLQIFSGGNNVTGGSAGSAALGETIQLVARATTSTTVPPGTSGAVRQCPSGTAQPQLVRCRENEDVTTRSTWSSSRSDVATVDANGLVTGKSVGSAQISAEFSGRTAVTTVTITGARLLSIVVSPDGQPISQGGVRTFTVQGRYSDAPTTPRTLNAGTTVNWVVTPTNLVSPNSGTGNSFTVTASSSATGTGTVTATVPGSGTTADVSDSATFTVTETSFTGVSSVVCEPSIIQAPTTANPAGTTSQCVASLAIAGGGSSPRPASEFDWTSSDTNLATVSPAGLVTPVAQGNVTITATLKAGVFPSIPAGASRSGSDMVTITGEVCTGPLLKDQGATAVGTASPLCLGCSVSNPDNAIDGDENSAAIMNQPLGLLAGTLTLDTVQMEGRPSFTSGGPAGFLIRQPAGMLLSAELLNQITVSTLRRTTAGLEVVQTGSGRSSTLRLTLLGMLGDASTAFIGVDTPDPDGSNGYDGLRLTFTSGVATALGQVNVFAACGTATVPAAAP